MLRRYPAVPNHTRRPVAECGLTTASIVKELPACDTFAIAQLHADGAPGPAMGYRP